MELIPLRLPSLGPNEKILKKLAGGGLLGAVAMGFVFALSFCPVSAALFFGSVIPISLKFNSGVFLFEIHIQGNQLLSN